MHISGHEITGQFTAGIHVKKPTEYTQKVLICLAKNPGGKKSEAKSETPFSLFMHLTKNCDIR